MGKLDTGDSNFRSFRIVRGGESSSIAGVSSPESFGSRWRYCFGNVQYRSSSSAHVRLCKRAGGHK